MAIEAGIAGVGEPASLLERELELGTVATLLQRVRAGRGGRLVIEGPAGIGKSALLEAACELATQDGTECLWAEASELGSPVAFGVVRTALGALWPQRSVRDEDGGTLGGPPAAAVLAASQRGVRAVLELAERTPVLVCVDDVQWADAASLRWLALLARRISGTRVGLALAVRVGELEREPAALRELLDDRAATVVRPAALSGAAVERLLSGRIGQAVDTELAAWCLQETNGNPYLLRALAGALRQAGVSSWTQARPRLRERGSRAIARSIGHRLERLEPDARRLLETIAVVGGSAGPVELAAIAELSPEDAAVAAHRLAELELVRAPDVLEPMHPLVGAAVRAQVAPDRRERLAREAARRLSAAGLTEQAAARLIELPPRGDAAVASTLIEAGALAFAGGAADVAATLLRRALAEPPPVEQLTDVRTELGRALLSLGDPAAVDVLGQALADAAPGPQAAALATMLAAALNYARRTDETVAVLDETRAALGPDEGALAEELEAMTLHYLTFDPEHRPQRARRLERLGDRRGASELAYRMRLAELASDSLTSGQPAGETVALAERALTGGVLLSRDVSAFLTAVLVLAYAGEPAAARARLTDAIESGRTRGDSVTMGFALAVHGEVQRIEGRMIAVESDIRTGLELLPPGELGPRFMLRGLIESLVAQDRVAEAEAQLRASELTGELPELMPTPGLLYATAMARIASGAAALGLETLRRAGEIAERLGLRDPISVPWRLAAAESLLASGDRERAAELAAAHLELARRTGLPEAIGAAQRVRGLLVGGADGRRLLAEAVSTLQPGFARLELARALVDLGAATRERDPRAARETLAHGAALAEQLGAVALCNRATDLVIAAGGRPRRAARSGASALTPAERRTARLAAEGMTNREIAETLVLSEKTVGTQLTAAFRKLGIHSRAQLDGALAGADAPSA